MTICVDGGDSQSNTDIPPEEEIGQALDAHSTMVRTFTFPTRDSTLMNIEGHMGFVAGSNQLVVYSLDGDLVLNKTIIAVSRVHPSSQIQYTSYRSGGNATPPAP